MNEMNNFKKYVDDAGFVLFKYNKYRDYTLKENKVKIKTEYIIEKEKTK